ncbi:MAG TPA: L,D-transpeptidase [Gemmatimonadaceae bacterium]|nr:L,D-transpeptidase [Gemmatimonadaceae bacterium]
MRNLALVLATATVVAPPLRAQQPADTLPAIEISIAKRRLWVLSPAGDTVYSAPAAVGSGRVLQEGAKRWTFETPTGTAVVVAREVAPPWIPPDWHYIEIARTLGLRTEQMRYGTRIALGDTTSLMARGADIGLIGADSSFRILPPDEEIIFGGVLYIPLFGTRNRRVEGTLGPYRLQLSNGIGIHGTPFRESIGTAATHGCIRLHDADITWLYENIPIGARVIIR